MIRVDVEEYCHQCLEFSPNVIPPIRSLDDNGERVQSDTIIQCKYRNRCAGIRRYFEQQIKGEVSG